MAIRIRNFYDENGSSTARRHVDESAQIEAQVDLCDRLLQVVSDIIYQSYPLDSQQSGGPKAPSYGNTGGDIIQFLGDQIIACFPGEPALVATAEAEASKSRVRAGSRDNKISIRDEEDAPEQKKEKRKKKSSSKKRNTSK